jgi:hypothetical protein
VAEDEDLRLAVSLVTRRSQPEDAPEHHVEEGEQHPRILRKRTLGETNRGIQEFSRLQLRDLSLDRSE